LVQERLQGQTILDRISVGVVVVVKVDVFPFEDPEAYLLSVSFQMGIGIVRGIKTSWTVAPDKHETGS
jgi:hypothetical protein